MASEASPSSAAAAPAVTPLTMNAQAGGSQDLAWLLEILRSVQLEQFYARIRDQLQVSRLEHFDYVQPEDLEKARKHVLKLRPFSKPSIVIS